MAKQTVAEKRDGEKLLVSEMIALYCRRQHKTPKGSLCPECRQLHDYALTRIDKCPFMETKTFCSACKVHCYKPEMREKIRAVIACGIAKVNIATEFQYDFQQKLKARLLEAGDLPSACRRLMVCACEDVGLAYPQIIPIVKAAVDAAQMLGLPEARLPLADAVVLVATSPKSNTAHDAINAAMADVQRGNYSPIPRRLQNKHYDGADAKVKGQFYKYPHEYENHWVEQQYLPDVLKGTQYYHFGDNKTEQAARAYWERVKKRKL